jgi:myo-inositol-1(or 4)-monophosphatase
MQPTLDYLIQITLDAGEILVSISGEELNIQHKSRTDLVTRADHEAEAFLIDSIRQGFPEHAINAEESGEMAGSAAHQWFIDPLDGTLNYAHGIPFYAVSVGYAFQGRMTLGVVYDPVRKELFSGEIGRGAALNGNPIHVSGYVDLIDCMLSTGFPPDLFDQLSDNMAYFREFRKQSQSIRRMGSAALDLAYVACGRFDGYWKTDLYPWDVAAGALIAQEAGAVVTDMDNGLDFMQSPISLVCANPKVHAEMIKVLEDVRNRQ